MLVPQHGYDPSHIASVSFPDGERGGVHVQLTLKGNQEIFRVEVLTIAAQSVFADGVRASADGNLLEFDLPGHLLSAGDYQVKLIRLTEGGEAVAATYYFRVQ